MLHAYIHIVNCIKSSWCILHSHITSFDAVVVLIIIPYHLFLSLSPLFLLVIWHNLDLKEKHFSEIPHILANMQSNQTSPFTLLPEEEEKEQVGHGESRHTSANDMKTNFAVFHHYLNRRCLNPLSQKK